MLRMDLEYNQGILFVRLKGELNKKSCFKVNNYLIPVLVKHKVKYLVYNLYLLDGIDEVGIDALLNTKCAIKQNKGTIVMCEVNRKFKEQLKRLNIKKIENERIALNLIEV